MAVIYTKDHIDLMCAKIPDVTGLSKRRIIAMCFRRMYTDLRYIVIENVSGNLKEAQSEIINHARALHKLLLSPVIEESGLRNFAKDAYMPKVDAERQVVDKLTFALRRTRVDGKKAALSLLQDGRMDILLSYLEALPKWVKDSREPHIWGHEYRSKCEEFGDLSDAEGAPEQQGAPSAPLMLAPVDRISVPPKADEVFSRKWTHAYVFSTHKVWVRHVWMPLGNYASDANRMRKPFVDFVNLSLQPLFDKSRKPGFERIVRDIFYGQR